MAERDIPGKRLEYAGSGVRRIKLEKPILVSDLDVVYIGTFVPKTCGIATFTNDLSTSIAQEMGDKQYRVVAITDRAAGTITHPRLRLRSERT
jgi:hypothetical protein